ncbi:DUF2142 domain-containing protein [Ruminococcaceae bacterium OttesenSCG-928-A16]|nr:DUF2142 domain-containing protein [Ruminococcaceae bacterium OttesenSCG-928-A16]
MPQNKTGKKRLALRPFSGKNIAMLLVVLLVCVGIFGWAGYITLPKAADVSRQEMVNEEADDFTTPLGAEDTIKQTLMVEGRLYGVSLYITNYGKMANGTLHLQLQNAAGETVASSNTNMALFPDNTFYRFVFDTMVDGGAGTEYTLVITASPHTPQDVVGFGKSTPAAQAPAAEEPPHYNLANFALTQNGQPAQGTLALRYVTQHAGNFIVRAYAFFAALVTAVLLLLYWCLFVQKIAVHRVFLVAAIGLGSVFMFLIPPRTAPDEYAHITTTYHYTNVLLGQPEIGEPGTLTVRAGDEMMLTNYDFGATDVFAYQRIAEGLMAPTPKGDVVAIPARGVSVFPFMYTAPTLGVLLARLLGLNQVWLLLLGRFANLLLFAFVGSRAIKRMPFAKPLLFCVGLLPMCLQLAASFCYDTYVLALAFYFTATVLDYTYNKKTMGIKQMVWLGLLAAFIAPAKTVYLVLVAMVFIIPLTQYKNKRFGWLARGGIVAAALLVWGIFNIMVVGVVTGSPVPTDAELASGIGANGDSLYFFTIRYILGHIPQTIKLLLLTLWQQGPLWLQGLIGGRLGEIIAINIEINWLFVIGMLVVVLLAALPDETDTTLLRTPHRWLFVAIALSVTGLFVLACITWTPINYTSIFGIQGRYFLPVLPLVLLAMRGKNLRFVKPAGAVLGFSMAALVALSQLDAFMIIVAR